MSQIHILDGQEDIILDYITAKNIISDNHKKSLEYTLETYDFITFADKRFSQFLEKRNRIIIPDEDDSLREFVIFEGQRYRDTEGHKVQVYANASYLELKKANIIYPNSFKGTASQHAGRALNDTGWQVGIVEVSGDITININEHTNPYENLRRIAKEFVAELRFRIEHDGSKVTGRYVDLLERVGDWQGREVTFGKDLDTIRRVEKQDIVTALLGLGPEKEDGTRIEVLVEDNDALQRWGRIDENGKLKHLIKVYEIQSERTEMTEVEARRYTRTALDKRIDTQVTYETTIVDLEEVAGHENKKIRFGDTIRIKDEKFNPPLYLEARVFEMTRSIKRKDKKDIKLGDYQEFTEEEVNALWTMLRREIRKKIDINTLKDYAEPKKIESNTPPPIKDGENPIWVDTSKTPKVAHVVIGGRWQKMTPTTPGEVDAYTKQQVDSKDTSIYNAGTSYADQKAQAEAEAKAAQALADAKAFSRNASNINSGVIDVGAIPLRTSITGARLEWDGVNGLVQYDSSGNPVSWIDLEANAHFSNAFLSGRIEASEGHFGDNIRLRNGKMEIVRPDGAVSMSNGMMDTAYTVTGADPHFMGVMIAGGQRGQNAFIPGGAIGYPNSTTSSHIYASLKGLLDGRGVPQQGDGYYSDIREPMGTIPFQRYYFVHSARYLVFAFRKYTGAKYSVHVMDRASGVIDDRLFFKLYEKDDAGIDYLTVDLGTPTFEKRNVTFKIGWTNGWGPRDEMVRFIMENVYLTDFID